MPRLINFRLLILPAMLAGALVLAACSNDDNNGNGQPNNPSGNATDDASNENGDENPAGAAGDAVSEITIDMYDNYFEPEEFTVQAGTTVPLTAVNEGAAAHNLVIKAADAEGQDFESEPFMGADDEDTFEFTVNESGEYVFQCDYHLPEMVGTLTVVE